MVEQKAKKETKEGKLVKLLSGKNFYSYEQIIKATGFSKASLDMYLSQGYLDRKQKPYIVIEKQVGKTKTYKYQVEGFDNDWHKPGKGKKK